MAGLLMVDEPRERVEQWRVELEAAGYRIVQSATEAGGALRIPASPPDAIVLSAPAPDCRAWEFLELLRADADMRLVPVVVIVGAGAWEDGLRGGIEGAVRCLAEPVEAERLVSTLDAVLAPDAPPVAEQRRYTRQRALEMLAAFESRGVASDNEVHPRLVHLTRLEHSPVRPAEPESLSDARRRLPSLTTKQRGLIQLIEAEGGVTAAAARLGTSRGNVYAGLRRIVHRLGVRDTGELLQIIGSGELLQSSR